MYTKYKLYKRVIDIAVVITIFIFLLPVFSFCYLLVIILMGRPVFFLQRRVGKNNKIFVIYKFRTMLPERNGFLGNEEARLTRLGKFLRKSSLDELPQMLNIIKGDMSLIGPRPLLPEYLPYYRYSEKKRHEVLPGLTGLSQVMGRNSLSWEKKFACDIYYVRNLSFLLDLKIIAKTFCSVITRSGVNAQEDLSMPRLDIERQNSNVQNRI